MRAALTKALGVTLRCVIFDRPQDFDLGYVDYPDATSTVKSKAPDVRNNCSMYPLHLH